MAIVGDRPESGVRIDVTRDALGGPPWRYRGNVVTPATTFPLEASISSGGLVTVEAPSAPAAMAERARLLLRAAWRHASDEQQPPPRRIVRWRPDGEADR
jgi:hypothetical protein